MRAAVLAAFPGFTTGFEGRLPFMYLDVTGLVTTGIGNLIDPVGAAMGLPWKHADGTPASSDEIEAEWNNIKSHQEMASEGGGAFRSIATLHLDPPDIDNLVQSKAHANESVLRGEFPSYDAWPADAQLAILSMAWAQGPGFSGWPHLLAALNASPPDFLTAAGPETETPSAAGGDTSLRGQAWMNDAGNPGLRPRNIADKTLFQNAHRVAAAGGDYEVLYYPAVVPAGGVAPASSGWSKLGQIALVLALLGGVGWALLSFTETGKRYKPRLVAAERQLVKRAVAWPRRTVAAVRRQLA